MHQLRLLINLTDQAAADDPEGVAAGILRAAADRIEERGLTEHILRDPNGNTVGAITLPRRAGGSRIARIEWTEGGDE